MPKITQNEIPYNSEHYSPELTQFANKVAESEPLTQQINFLAPTTYVNQYFDYKENAYHSLSPFIANDIRATGSDFKTLDFNGEIKQGKVQNKGFIKRVDSNDQIGDWEERTVYGIIKHLLSNEYRRIIELMTGTIKTSKQVIEIGPWTAKALPDAVVRSALLNARKQYGFTPNRLLIHSDVWYARYACLSGQNNAAAHAVDLSFEDISKILFVDGIQLIPGNFPGLEGNEIFAIYTQNGLLKDEDCAMKRFATSFDNGNLFQVYIEPHTKYTDIIVECYSIIIVTSSNYILQLKLKSA